MNIDDIATQMLYTTVPIWTTKNDGSQSIGTGFIYTKQIENNKSMPVIVTNKHVLENSKHGMIALVKNVNGMPSNKDRITVALEGSLLTNNFHDSYDIAIFPLGPILNQLMEKNIIIFFKSITKEIFPSDEIINNLSAIEDITFIGYPSGLYDRKNNSPIIRQGITASPYWNDFNGKPLFLIDAGVYPGSSGSPVFIYNRGTYPTKEGIAVGNRILFLGIITETLLRQDLNNTQSYLNLGLVLKSNIIRSFIDNILIHHD